jgi:transcription initiation factor TFIIH subunit 3
MSSRLLFIVVDCNPLHWSNLESNLSFVEFFENILLFIQNYLLLNSANKFNVILFDNNRAQYLVDTQHFQSDFIDFEKMKSILIDSFKSFFATSGMATGTNYALESSPKLTRALSQTLLYINKRCSPNQDSQIVLFSPSMIDSEIEYIAIMNIIFAAVKMKVLIDCILLTQTDSNLAQQMSHLTGGLYVKPSVLKNLSLYLLTTILCPPLLRNQFSQVSPNSIKLSASCFCHKKPVDIGFVCSCCLSIFCSPQVSCPTCELSNPTMMESNEPTNNNNHNNNNNNNNNKKINSNNNSPDLIDLM